MTANFVTTLTRAQEIDYHKKGSDKRITLSHKQLTTPGYDMITINKESLKPIHNAILKGVGARVPVIRISTIYPDLQQLDSWYDPPRKKEDKSLLTALSKEQRGKARMGREIRLRHEQLDRNPAIDGLILSLEDKSKVAKAVSKNKGVALKPISYKPSSRKEIEADGYKAGYNRGYVVGHNTGALAQKRKIYEQGYRAGFDTRRRHNVLSLVKPDASDLI